MVSVILLPEAEGCSQRAVLKGKQSCTIQGTHKRAAPAPKTNVMTFHQVQLQAMVLPHSPPFKLAASFTESLGVDDPSMEQQKPPKDPMTTLNMSEKLETIIFNRKGRAQGIPTDRQVSKSSAEAESGGTRPQGRTHWPCGHGHFRGSLEVRTLELSRKKSHNDHLP